MDIKATKYELEDGVTLVNYHHPLDKWIICDRYYSFDNWYWNKVEEKWVIGSFVNELCNITKEEGLELLKTIPKKEKTND